MGSVRIVGGALKGRRLRVFDRGVRPTSERTREAIFDILGPETVEGASVLDLYAGTGALGIEALSRGARTADFVEGDRGVARRLVENIGLLGLADRARVRVADLDRAALPPGLAGPWRLVFLDPPYAGDTGQRWVASLAAAQCFEPGALVVYERRKGPAVPLSAALTLATERTYGDTTVAFYRADSAPRGGA